MKRTKNTHILVFGLLNLLNQIAAVGLMIYSSFLPAPVPHNWNPPVYLRSVVICVPLAIVINFTWLMVWLFMTKRAKTAFIVLNAVTLTVTVLLSLYAKINHDNISYTPEQPEWVSALKYCIPIFIVINGAWLIVTIVRRRKQKSNSLEGV